MERPLAQNNQSLILAMNQHLINEEILEMLLLNYSTIDGCEHGLTETGFV
jgi:hypothetical protein